MADEPPVLAELGQAIAAASEAQIMQAVGMIDALAERGAADALLDPIRPRLRRLRPPRRLRFARVLLHPLDPLIVAPTAWRENEPVLPRGALLRVAHYVRSAMGEAATVIEEQVAGHTTAEAGLIDQVGRRLWPRAARIIDEQGELIEGLAEDVGKRNLHGFLRTTAALLREAPAVAGLIADTANGMLPLRLDAIAGIADRIAAVNEAALPMLLTVLLTYVPQAATALDAMPAGRMAGQLRAARDQAAMVLLRRLDADIDIGKQITEASLGEAGLISLRMLQFLNQVAGGRLKREQIQQIRQKLASACESRFGDGIETELLQPILEAVGQLETKQVIALESTARDLRALEETGRSIRGEAHYDEMLRHAVGTISAESVSSLTLADRVRLVEILAGADAALDLLA